MGGGIQLKEKVGHFLFIFYLVSLFWSFNLFADSFGISPHKVKSDSVEIHSLYQNGKMLVRQGRKVFKEQPTLYRDSRFIELQRWTLKYQRLSKGVELAYLSQFLQNSSYLGTKEFYLLYLKLYQQIEQLVSELPSHLSFHFWQNSEYAQPEWKRKILKTLGSMQIKGDYSSYVYSDCDYVAQPLNYLWFGLEALEILDHLGRSYNQREWNQKTRSLNSLENFRPMDLSDFDLMEPSHYWMVR